MEELKAKLAEILEVEDLDTAKKFQDYDEWDSLTALTIIAMLDADYRMAMKGADLLAFGSIEEFCNKVLGK